MTALGGCYTLEHRHIAATQEEHVVVSNYGWKLFGAIPLACGNASGESNSPFVFFHDEVTNEILQRRFMEYANSKGKVPSDLMFIDHNTIFISIPGTSIPIPIPWLVCYRDIQLTGVLK